MAAPRTAEILPNFVIAGVPKAGTTSLHSYLAQHPEIFMSRIKEPAFFGAADILASGHGERLLAWKERQRAELRAYLDGPQAPGARFPVLDWDDYRRLFRDVAGERAIGEATVDYFWQPGAPAAIRTRLPGARIIVMLRHPADTLFARYLLDLPGGGGRSFRAWFEAAVRRPDSWMLPVGHARLATNLGRFLDAFPREQVRCYLYPDYLRDPRGVLREIFGFLGVAADAPIDLSRRLNETSVPRWPRLDRLRRRLLGGRSVTGWAPAGLRAALRRGYRRTRGSLALDPADRALVIDVYRGEIEATAELIARDLSSWLR